VVVHVLMVVGQVGDGLVDVGEVQVAGAGVGAGFRGEAGQGRGDCFRAAVQDSQALSVGPLAGGGGLARVQCGGRLAEVAADVDEVDEDRDFQRAGSGVVVDGGDLLLVAVYEEHALAGVVRVAAVGLVERLADHRGDVIGNGGRYPLVPCGGAGVGLAARGWGGDVFRLPYGGGGGGDRDDLRPLFGPCSGGRGRGVLLGVPP